MGKRSGLAAYCLVTYRTKSGLEERVWNSTNGNVPLFLVEKTTGEMADLVRGKLDYRPDYVPELGERILVPIDDAAIRRQAERIVDDPGLDRVTVEAFNERYSSREEAIDGVVGIISQCKDDLVNTVYVTSGVRDQIIRERKAGLRIEREVDNERAKQTMAALMLAAAIDPSVKESVANAIEAIDFRDRDGNKISFERMTELRADEGYVLLADTQIAEDFRVMTRWSGLDPDKDRLPPRVFQTAFMRRKRVGDPKLTAFIQRMYVTEAEAFRGHAELVRKAREQVQDQLE